MNRIALFLLVASFTVSAAEDPAEAVAGPPPPDVAAAAAEQAAIAEALNNPLSSLWIMFTQNDTTWYKGDLVDDLGKNTLIQNTTLIQPVMPFQLTENWKAIFRPIIPINSFETVDNLDVSSGTVPDFTGTDFDREAGLGDIILWTALSNSYKPPLVWGFGPTVMLPTATDSRPRLVDHYKNPVRLDSYVGCS
jgi:hypothetical protein